MPLFYEQLRVVKNMWKSDKGLLHAVFLIFICFIIFACVASFADYVGIYGDSGTIVLMFTGIFGIGYWIGKGNK